MLSAVLHEQAEVCLLLQAKTGSEDLGRATGGNRTEIGNYKVANVRILGPQTGPPVPTEGYLAVSLHRQVCNYRTSHARVPKRKDTVFTVCCRGHAEVFDSRVGC